MIPLSKDAVKRKITTGKNAAFFPLQLAALFPLHYLAKSSAQIIKKTFLTFAICFAPSSFALTCVPVVAQWGTVSYITQNALSCSATEWAVFTPATLSAYNATIAASASGVPAATTSATVSNVSASFTNGLLTGGALVSVCLLAWGFSAVRRVLH